MVYPAYAQTTYLFTNYHHIQCGDLVWKGSDGKDLPLCYQRGLLDPPVAANPEPRNMPRGIRLEAQKAHKSGSFGNVLELPPSSLVFEGGMYRVWYPMVPANASFGVNDSNQMGYAESYDGMRWRTPELGKFEINGSRANNVVFGQEAMPNLSRGRFGTVFVDCGSEPVARYKMIFHARPPESDLDAILEKYAKYDPLHRTYAYTRTNLMCAYGAVSPDGINWTLIDQPMTTQFGQPWIHFMDTWNTVHYDRWLERYVMYTRDYPRERRIISRTESEDFRSWSPPTPVICPRLDEPPTLDLYSNCFSEYPGEPNIRLMFPQVYDRYDQTSQIRMASSADGLAWQEVPGGAVLSPGSPGEWDSEYLAVGTGLVPFGEDRIGLIYSGSAYPHKYPRWNHVLSSMKECGWAWWPRGRLSAVVADEEGEFWTFPVKPRSRRLRLNFMAHKGGNVRVGIHGKAGRDIKECDTLTGDELHKTVTWKGRPETEFGVDETVMLHFRLRRSKLFGFEWEK